MKRALYMLAGAVLMPIAAVAICVVACGVIALGFHFVAWLVPVPGWVWAAVVALLMLLALMAGGAGAGNDFWRHRQERRRAR